MVFLDYGKEKYIGYGSHYGTCGELVQGTLSDGKYFHITAPVKLYTKIEAKVVKSLFPKFKTPKGMSKCHKAIEMALESLDKKGYSVKLTRKSELVESVGMASSTADIIATVKAVLDAFGHEPLPHLLAHICYKIESSDGIMYPGVNAVNQKTGEIYYKFKNIPKYKILIISNGKEVKTGDFNKFEFPSCEDILENIKAMDRRNDFSRFGWEVTRSALRISQKRDCDLFMDLYGYYEKNSDVLGICAAHTGSVYGLLFKDSDNGYTDVIKVKKDLESILDNCEFISTELTS